jgi:high affinity sulfate transporter 1
VPTPTRPRIHLRPLRPYVPGVALVRTYERAWLSKDIVAGLVLSALLIPQGMAYAELAGLPAITGLYTSVLCLLGYAVFGPSRVLVLGPDSALGPMIAATLAPLLLADGDPARAVALASVLSLMVGLIQVIVGLAKFGFIADLLSRPTQIGYLNGLALTIVVSQLPKLFGFSVDADGLLDDVRGFVEGVIDGLGSTTSLVLGVSSLLLIVVLNRAMPKLPAVLLVVVAGTVAVILGDLVDQGVPTVGKVPRGFPPLTVPSIDASDVLPLMAGALAISLVTLADTMSNASAFAARRGERVHGDQEMFGIGAANLASGLFQGFPVSASGSRTAVADQAGSRSQLTGVVGALVIVVVLAFATSLMEYVPQPVLAAVVIAAAFSLADFAGSLRLLRQRRSEFALSLATFLGVAFFGVLAGIGIAVGLSILNVFRRLWWPYQTELGRVSGMGGLHDIESYPNAQVLPGLIVYRFDAPLIFANSRTFSDQIRAMVKERADIRWIVIAAGPITDVDTTASAMLVELDEWANRRGVSLVFAEMKDPVREKIERYELTRTIDPEHFFPSVDDALRQYVAETGARWRELDGDERV